MTLAEILRDSNYKITQFGLIQIQEFENRIITRTDKNNKPVPYNYLSGTEKGNQVNT